MKKLILVVVLALLVGCLGKQKGLIILKNDKEIRYKAWIFYDNQKMFLRGDGVEYNIPRKMIKSMTMQEMRE